MLSKKSLKAFYLVLLTENLPMSKSDTVCQNQVNYAYTQYLNCAKKREENDNAIT